MSTPVCFITLTLNYLSEMCNSAKPEDGKISRKLIGARDENHSSAETFCWKSKRPKVGSGEERKLWDSHHRVLLILQARARLCVCVCEGVSISLH